MENLFDIQDLSFAYGKKKVLCDLNFTLSPGTFYGVIGPNGSGKTTLLDQLCGLNKHQTGSVLFKNRPVHDYSRRELAKELSLVPQEFSINFDFSVREVVLMGRHPHIPRFSDPDENDQLLVKQAMECMEIIDFQDRMVTELSGGEKQRVIMARALAQNTKVIILDEATANLDIQHSIQIFKVVRELTAERGGTVVAAIHDLNFAAAYCDQLILLDKGKIVATGTPKETLNKENLKNTFGLQVRPYTDQNSGAYQLAYNYYI